MLVRTQYEQLIYTLPSRYSSIRLSTLVLTPPGMDSAQLTGLVAFGDDLVLCAYELLDFFTGHHRNIPLRGIALPAAVYRKPAS